MKKGKTIAVVLLTTVMLTGCIDKMPDMTQEQTDLVAEYAADLMLKYSPNYNYKLVDVDEVTEETTTEEETATQETSKPETTNADVPASQGQETTPEETAAVEEEQSILDLDLASALGEETCEILYIDHDVYASYPLQDASFCVSPAKDHQLLVVTFAVTNTDTAKATCDMYDANPSIVAIINGTTKVKAMNSLLPNDITTFIGDIDGNTTQEMVALFEISDSDVPIDSLSLKFGSDAYTVD